MGNCFSGWRSHQRPPRKATTEGRLTLDVRRIHREGALAPGTPTRYTWRPRGGPQIAVSLLAADTCLFVTPEGKGRPLKVNLDATACAYGGTRPWFLCPGCNRRAALLYLEGGELHCRTCLGLTYESCREEPHQRALRRHRRIRRRIGGDPFGILPDQKPPGMHWTTYSRLHDEAARALAESLRLYNEKLERMGIAIRKRTADYPDQVRELQR